MQKKLTASLHTVTAVSRVAVYLSNERKRQGFQPQANEAEFQTANALAILGYDNEANELLSGNIDPGKVVGACLAAVRKAL